MPISTNSRFTWIVHLLGGGIILLLGLQMGYLDQKEKEISEATVLTHAALMKSIPARQYVIFEVSELWQSLASAFPNPKNTAFAEKAVFWEHAMDSIIQTVEQYRNEPEKVIPEFSAMTQVHDSIFALFEWTTCGDIIIDRFSPLLFSDQLQWHAGQPITLQLLLAYRKPLPSEFSINTQPIQNNYQQQFNEAGTYPLKVIAKSRWLSDSVEFTYFVQLK